MFHRRHRRSCSNPYSASFRVLLVPSLWARYALPKCIDSDTALILLSLHNLPQVSWYFRFQIEEPIRVSSSINCEHFSVLEAVTEDKDISHPHVEAPACAVTTGFCAS